MLLRKLFTLFAACLFVTNVVNGQSCVVDTNNYDLLAPLAEEIPCVEKGVPFDAVLQFFTPPSLAGITIDSIRLTTFNNLPTGLSTLCAPVTCKMNGNGRACINITGTATDTGIYNIIYNGFLYTDQGTAPFSYVRANYPGILPEFRLTVINPGDTCFHKPVAVPTGIAKTSAGSAGVFSVYPNPANGNFIFKLNAGAQLNGQVSVTDVTGKVIFTQPSVTALSAINIDISHFSKGLYLIEYRTSSAVATRKIVVE